MKASRKELVKPTAYFGLSFIALILIMLLTSPLNKIGYAVLFFVVLFAVLSSLGFLIARIWGAEDSPRNKYRIFVISLFIIISLMFRSAQSFNWVDGLIVLLVAFGLLFYGGRRF